MLCCTPRCVCSNSSAFAICDLPYSINLINDKAKEIAVRCRVARHRLNRLVKHDSLMAYDLVFKEVLC